MVQKFIKKSWYKQMFFKCRSHGNDAHYLDTEIIRFCDYDFFDCYIA